MRLKGRCSSQAHNHTRQKEAKYSLISRLSWIDLKKTKQECFVNLSNEVHLYEYVAVLVILQTYCLYNTALHCLANNSCNTVRAQGPTALEMFLYAALRHHLCKSDTQRKECCTAHNISAENRPGLLLAMRGCNTQPRSGNLDSPLAEKTSMKWRQWIKHGFTTNTSSNIPEK